MPRDNTFSVSCTTEIPDSSATLRHVMHLHRSGFKAAASAARSRAGRIYRAKWVSEIGHQRETESMAIV